jgi:hypothetical protein
VKFWQKSVHFAQNDIILPETLDVPWGGGYLSRALEKTSVRRIGYQQNN